MDRTKLRWNGWGFAAHKDELAGRDEVWSRLAAELDMPALLATPARPLEEIDLPPGALSAETLVRLAALVGADRVRIDGYERAFHAGGRSYRDLLKRRAGDVSGLPDAVVYPRASEEVLAILAFAADEEIAVLPYGGGTGQGTARGSAKGMLMLDMSEMDRLIALDPISHTAVVQAGICGPALEKALETKGFMLGHLPETFEFSTLGGAIASNSTGQTAMRSGAVADWLIAAKLATPEGVFATGDVPALKNLLIGSSGRLGIITEAELRIRPLPETCDYRGYLFADFASGAAALREAVQARLPAAMLRLLDSEATRLLDAYESIGQKRGLVHRLAEHYRRWRGFTDKPCLMITGFEGARATATFARKRFEAIARRHGALALGREIGERWKKMRFAAPYLRDALLERGVGAMTAATPARWSDIETVYAARRTAIKAAIAAKVPREGAKGLVLCHVGQASADGAQLCFTAVFPRLLDGDLEQAAAIAKAAGATEDKPNMAVMRAAKSAFDSKGVLQPGTHPPG